MEKLIKSYAGKPCPASLIVEKVKLDPLPSVVNTSRTIPMKAGEQFIDKRYGTRTISADVTIIASDTTKVFEEGSTLAEWLNYDEPQPLVLRDLPDRTFYAIIDSTNLEKTLELGRGQITFTCHDPHAYGEEKTYAMNPDTTAVVNEGNLEAFPIINFTVKKNVTDFFITGANETIYLGEPFDPSEKTVTDTRPYVFNDSGASTGQWSQAIDYLIDGGTVTGELSSNGYSFQQKAKDYGTGTTWHGGAMVRSLGKEVQDFDLEASIGFQSSKALQKGRVEVYLLDKNNNRLAKIALKDIDSGLDNPMYDAWLGRMGNGGVQTVNSYGGYKGVWKNFNGVINIGRRGKQWHFYIAQVNPTTYQHHTRYYKTVTDTWGRFGGKLAKVLIHIGTHNTSEPVNSMWISNVRVNELLPKATNQVSYIAKANDTFTIDCESGEILRNGQFLTQQYAGTEFIQLLKGANGIKVSDPTIIKDGTISFTERWL